MLLKIDRTLAHWATAQPWINAACKEGDGWFDIGFVEELLQQGKAVLWIASDEAGPHAACITAVEDFSDGRRVAEICFAGGRDVICDLPRFVSDLEAWARLQGANEIMFRGRRGWLKPYAKLGFKEIAITMRKAL